jgi:hypothetical protein
MEGLFQPMHLLALAVFFVPVFLIGGLLWRLGSRKR